MATRRQQRVAELIHKEISNSLQFNIHDPRIGFVTVTLVTVTPDLKEATIFVSLLSGEEKETLVGLESATPYLKRELGQQLRLRYTPALHFEVDHSQAYGEKIDTLLAQLDIPPEAGEPPPPDNGS
ncbi:MAG: 30S ribosome-binding factor RbfA [Anaerolineae bacterium]